MNYISVGPVCHTAQALKDSNLRRQAYPFDWVYSTLPMVLRCIGDRFQTFLDKSKYSYIEGGVIHATYNPMLTTDFLFEHGRRENRSIHDKSGLFSHFDPFNDEVHASLQRRSARFMTALQDPNTCLIYRNLYFGNYDDIIAFARELRAQAFPCRVVGLVWAPPGLLLFQEGNLVVYGCQDAGEISGILAAAEAAMSAGS